MSVESHHTTHTRTIRCCHQVTWHRRCTTLVPREQFTTFWTRRLHGRTETTTCHILVLSSTGAVCWHLSLLPSTPSPLRQNDVSSSSRGSAGAGTTTCSNPPACCGLILEYSQQGSLMTRQSDSAHCFPVAHTRKPPEYSPPGD